MSEPTIRSRIIAARAELGLTQRSLADKLGFRDSTNVSKWERGIRSPNPSDMKKLDEVLFSKIRKRDAEIKGAVSPAAPPSATKSAIKLALYLGSQPVMKTVILSFLEHAENAGMTLSELIEMLK